MMDERNFQTTRSSSSRDVLGFYDAYAPNWDERFGRTPTTEHFHGVRVNSFLTLARLRADQRLVELGVGTGPYLQAIAPRVAHVTAVDGSAGMLEVLKRKHAALANLDVLQRDLESTGQDVNFEADIVYWFGLLEHVIDADAFAANCRRMLKPGGRLIFAAPNGRCPWYGVMRKAFRAGAHCSSDHYYTPEESDALFHRFGFVRDGLVYWGYAPAGVPGWLYTPLTLAGHLIDRTPLRKYAGGMTLSYTLAC
jgi:SAM-dependent methyltransferase